MARNIDKLVHDLSGCKTGLEFLLGRLTQAEASLNDQMIQGASTAIGLYALKVGENDTSTLGETVEKTSNSLIERLNALKTNLTGENTQQELSRAIDEIALILQKCQ